MDEPHRHDTLGVWLTYSLCKAIRAADRRRLRAEFDSDAALARWLGACLSDPRAARLHPRLLSRAQHDALRDPALPYLVDTALHWRDAQARHHLIGLSDVRYPAALRDLPDPPWLLYVNGQAAELAGPHVAIVGSRRASPPARQFTHALAAALARAGLGVVSGLAQGIDGAAHQGCLAADGVTLAVAATPPDRIYPAAHRELARQITARGAVVSEFALGTALRPGCFPRRNRLISGLCLGVVVVEAALRSGSLITARLALDQGREVMAVPGSVLNPQARGCHALIKDGAALVESAEDVLAVLAPVLRRQWPDLFSAAPGPVCRPPAPPGLPGLAVSSHEPGTDGTPGGPADTATPAHAAMPGKDAELLQALGFDPAGLEELTQRLSRPPGEIAGGLTRLEIAGWIQPTADGRYIRCKRRA